MSKSQIQSRIDLRKRLERLGSSAMPKPIDPYKIQRKMMSMIVEHACLIIGWEYNNRQRALAAK